MQLTLKSTYVTRFVKLARYVIFSVYEHDDRAQSGTTHSSSVIVLHEAKPVLGLFCLTMQKRENTKYMLCITITLSDSFRIRIV